MAEPRTREEVIESIKKFEKELEQLEKDKPKYAPDKQTNGLEYLKVGQEMKRRFELRQLIRKYKNYLAKDCYRAATTPLVQDLSNLTELPKFSWGIVQKDTPDREVIFEQSTHTGDYIKVTNYGKFHYLNGQSNVSIENMPDRDNMIIGEVPLVRKSDKVAIRLEDIQQLISELPEYFGESLNLVRITKDVGERQRDYFVLSPINKSQLEDAAIRKCFIEEYCSDIYLDSVVNGENGIYAGNIIKAEDGSCSIKYSKDSTRAAKMAELLQGDTELLFNISKEKVVRLHTRTETFKQIRDRFLAEILKERREKIEKERE